MRMAKEVFYEDMEQNLDVQMEIAKITEKANYPPLYR